MNRTPIGDCVDHDMRLYRFERSSGLPRGYFGRRWPIDTIVFVAILTLGALALVVVYLSEFT